MTKRVLVLSISLMAFVLVTGIVIIWVVFPTPNRILKGTSSFSGDLAYEHVVNQITLGPRTPGSQAHEQTIQYISSVLEKNGWIVETQAFEAMGHPGTNIIARRGEGTPWIVLGAHYDSRLYADRDLEHSLRTSPVPGANDGASGVAILLELARSLPVETDQQIWLVFFDLEDQGAIEGWDWILGSKAFVAQLTSKPDLAIIIDMVGDKNLNIYMEKNSDNEISEKLWSLAKEQGYASSFISTYKYQILDDHLPFLEAGIPAVDIIDFDYPYWHTTQDTSDKVSSSSLKIVGDVLFQMLLSDR